MITILDLENSLQRASIMRALNIINHIKNHCREQEEIYDTFTNKILARTKSDIGTAVQVAATVSKNTDFLRIIEKYLDPLLDGLSLNYIPKHDLTLYHNLGINPDSSIHISAGIIVRCIIVN
jgi:hypothetical protein